MSARLEIIQGPMFAGKSTALIGRLTQARHTGVEVCTFKHAKDARYHSTAVATHNGTMWPAQAVENAETIVNLVGNADVVGIDEIHFFGTAAVPVIKELLSDGRRIIVAGVDLDARGQPFAPFPQLAVIADDITQLHASCTTCGQPAIFTQRLSNARGLHHVGGTGDYEPRCTAHFEPQKDPP
jgi:thymidine kinase